MLTEMKLEHCFLFYFRFFWNSRLKTLLKTEKKIKRLNLLSVTRKQPVIKRTPSTFCFPFKTSLGQNTQSWTQNTNYRKQRLYKQRTKIKRKQIKTKSNGTGRFKLALCLAKRVETFVFV